jgi:hypothetical protein
MEGLFRVSNYRLFHVNAEAGLFEKKLMNTEIFLSRLFKAVRLFLKRMLGVPTTLSMPKASWGHARRQSFGDLVCLPGGSPLHASTVFSDIPFIMCSSFVLRQQRCARPASLRLTVVAGLHIELPILCLHALIPSKQT